MGLRFSAVKNPDRSDSVSLQEIRLWKDHMESNLGISSIFLN